MPLPSQQKAKRGRPRKVTVTSVKVTVHDQTKCPTPQKIPRINMASNEAQRISECPVCLEVLSPPIFQCSSGHLICDKCLERFKKCPTCKDDLTKKIRNLAMEQLVADALHDCPNLGKGCIVMCTRRELDHHVQTLCHFEMKKYCSILGLPCEFNGSLAELPKHLTQNHKTSGCAHSQILIHQLFPDEKTLNSVVRLRWDPHFILMDGNIFTLRTHADMDETSVSWMVNVMGPSSVADQYAYRIELFSMSDHQNEDWNNAFTLHEGQVLPFSTKFSSSLILLSASFRHLTLLGKQETRENQVTVCRYQLVVSILKNSEDKTRVPFLTIPEAPAVLSTPAIF